MRDCVVCDKGWPWLRGRASMWLSLPRLGLGPHSICRDPKHGVCLDPALGPGSREGSSLLVSAASRSWRAPWHVGGEGLT